MAKSGALRSSVLIVWPDVKGSLKLPFWKGSRVELRTVSSCSVGVTGVALPCLKGEKKDIKKVAVQETTVLRLALVKSMAPRDDWEQAN